jgi:cytoskeletal protein CcmA (bactofilin family)
MAKHLCRGLLTALVVTLLIIFATAPAAALDIRNGQSVTVASGEVVHDDLLVAADTITIDGTVDGDLWAIGTTVTINGVVNGNVVAAGQIVSINGNVEDTVWTVGQTINVGGNINGDLQVAGLSMNIANTAKIKGNLLFVAGITSIESPIEDRSAEDRSDRGGNERGGEVATSNGANGNAYLEVVGLTIFPTANMQDDLGYIRGSGADMESGTPTVVGATHTPPPGRIDLPRPFALFSGVLGKVTSFLMAFVAGLVIILLIPRHLTSITESIRTRPWASLGWGAVILFVTPIAAILVCFTIVGISVGLIALLFYAVALYLAQIPVALFLGRWIIGSFKAVDGKPIMLGALALGLVIIHLLRLIPYFGFFVSLVVILFGLGAVVVWERKRRAEAARAH